MKTQPSLWTERPTGAVMEAGSLWPEQGRRYTPPIERHGGVSKSAAAPAV